MHINYGPDQIQQSIHSYGQAKEYATELGMRPLLDYCHMGLGRLYLKRGQCEKSRSQLTAALELYRSMDMRFWLPQAEAALTEIK